MISQVLKFNKKTYHYEIIKMRSRGKRRETTPIKKIDPK